MRIYMEYLRRHRQLDKFFRPPCACFLESKTGKLAVGIHEIPDKPFYLLKYWDISKRELKSPLPDFVQGFRTAEDILQGKFIPEGYSPVSYEMSAIPVRFNGENHPMPEPIFNDRYDNLLESGDESMSRKMWLWGSFLSAYHLPVQPTHYSALDNFRFQLAHVQMDFRRHHQYWQMWCQHMIEFQNNGWLEMMLTSSSCDDGPA